MMNENAKILFFCMIFVGKSALAQTDANKLLIVKHLSIPQSTLTKIRNTEFNKNTYKIQPLKPVLPTINKVSAVTGPVSYSLISPSYYTQNFGFFCKRELQLEKVTKIPFKFRLGSVQQCDWMERKPNAVQSF